MIYPIVGYGDPVLRKKADEITFEYPNLKQVIANMFETMYQANGVGLAAPQVGLSIRLFIIDPEPMDEAKLKGNKKVFINPLMMEEVGAKWAYNEGCLSIPGVREDVMRREKIIIKYLDENFVEHTDTYDGKLARVIQHEYDHIEGILFIDHLSPLKRSLLKSKLNDISRGKTNVDYRMRMPRK